MKNKKTERISTRVDDGVTKALRNKAKKAGMGLSEYIRDIFKWALK